jgi:hypothetical protein
MSVPDTMSSVRLDGRVSNNRIIILSSEDRMMMRTEFGLGGCELVADWVIEMVERWNQTINQWICRVEASWFAAHALSLSLSLSHGQGTRSTILGFYGIRWVCFIYLQSLFPLSPKPLCLFLRLLFSCCCLVSLSTLRRGAFAFRRVGVCVCVGVCVGVFV